jgi:6-phosphogluconolactonase/glucosamine-6-phosphate isomerase/deaminase
MKIEVFTDVYSAARQAAALIAAEARMAVAARDRFVMAVSDGDVGITGVYQKRRRMTLSYPILNRARRILWLVTGSEKTGMLGRLLKADTSIPAGRVNQARAVVFADRAAAKNVQLGCKDYEVVEQLVGQG